jgi:copper resistance protein B
MKKYCVVLLLTLLVVPAYGGMEDDPLLAKLMIDQLEYQFGDGDNALAWDAQGWVGKDLNKLWIKSEGAYQDSQIDENELQLLYSRAVAPFWDAQIGWRGNLEPTPSRNWLAVGVEGLAPYFFDIEASAFLGENGRTAARLKVAYEFLFTQKLILTPEVEVNLYGKDDPAATIGSGFSNIETGLRLRYEIQRELAPYIGINWNHLFGDTADYAEVEGQDADSVQFVIGIKSWF